MNMLWEWEISRSKSGGEEEEGGEGGLESRWRELVRYVETRANQHGDPFASLLTLHTLGRNCRGTRNWDKVNDMLKSMENHVASLPLGSSRREQLEKVWVPFAKAIAFHDQGMDTEAYQAVVGPHEHVQHDARGLCSSKEQGSSATTTTNTSCCASTCPSITILEDLKVVGGSNEQREVLKKMWIDVLIGAERWKEAEEILSQTTSGKRKLGWYLQRLALCKEQQ